MGTSARERSRIVFGSLVGTLFRPQTYLRNGFSAEVFSGATLDYFPCSPLFLICHLLFSRFAAWFQLCPTFIRVCRRHRTYNSCVLPVRDARCPG